MGILDMLTHIASENAEDFKSRDRSRGPGLTEAALAVLEENREWDAFKVKLLRRQALVGDAYENAESAADAAGAADEAIAAVIDDEDDTDMLLDIMGVLERSKQALTIFEIVRALQAADVLSTQFTAAARAQTVSLLGKLRAANRVWQDPQGRWLRL